MTHNCQDVVDALRNVTPSNLVGLLAGKRPGDDVTHPHLPYYHADCGLEHYQLLSYVASLFQNSLLVDIGTHIGLSALALSGGTNRVLTFDIEPKVIQGLPFPASVEFSTVNVAHDREAFPLDATFALLDIDPHAGQEERAIVQQLVDRGWKGLMMCDDIFLNAGMREFWEFCKGCECLQTHDLTPIGHSTGTGLLVFS